MGTDEEYLDSLLRSVTADLANEEKKTEGDNISEEEMLSIDDFFETQESFLAENENGEAEEISIGDLILGDETPERVIADGDTALDIDAMLKELNLLDEDIIVPSEKEEIKEDLELEPFLSNDITEEVDEINQLLEKADNNEAISDDIFSLFATTDVIEMGEDGSFDLLGEMNYQEEVPVEEEIKTDKKAEKERKRQEKAVAKEAAKEAKKAAKEAKKAAKAQKNEKISKEQEETAEDTEVLSFAEFTELNQENETVISKPSGQFSFAEEDSFGDFQSVDEFDDIESLLSSLNMEELEAQATPVKTQETSYEPEKILSVDDLKFDDEAENDIKEKPETSADGKGEKKESWFKRFIDFLMEEDEDEDEDDNTKKKKSVQTVDIGAGDSAIINELEKRGKKASKGKKNGKGKNPLDDEDDETVGKKSKKGKKVVKKKTPETGMSKRYKLLDPDEKKIGKAGSLAIVLLAASVFAVVFLSNIVFTPMLAKYRAQKAFKEQDYKTCYQEFYGWDLNEKEQNMVDVSKVVLKMERRLEAYEQNKKLRRKVEALDSLMKAVQNYNEIYQEAINCGADGEVEARYNTIIDILAEEYGLSEKEAKAIATTNSDVEYTRYLNAIISGEVNVKPENGGFEELPGLLPEEEELPDTNFSE